MCVHVQARHTNQIQIHFVGLVALGVVAVFELDHVGVTKLLHDLELSVLAPRDYTGRN